MPTRIMRAEIVTAPQGINADGFYGIAPMHCRPNATKLCT